MKILIAYSSKYGSTKETSEFIKEILEKKKHHVDLIDIAEISTIDCDFLIVASSIRMGRIPADTFKFVKKFENEIKTIDNSIFVHCVTIKNETSENFEKVKESIQPVLNMLNTTYKPGIFAGKVDYSKLGWLSLNLAKRDKTGFMAEGDFRDWEKIKKWVNGLNLQTS